MARGCLCCLKYMMFLFNLIFWLPDRNNLVQNLYSMYEGSDAEKKIYVPPPYRYRLETYMCNAHRESIE